jgi:hypothetical protein
MCPKVTSSVLALEFRVQENSACRTGGLMHHFRDSWASMPSLQKERLDGVSIQNLKSVWLRLWMAFWEPVAHLSHQSFISRIQKQQLNALGPFAKCTFKEWIMKCLCSVWGQA